MAFWRAMRPLVALSALACAVHGLGSTAKARWRAERPWAATRGRGLRGAAHAGDALPEDAGQPHWEALFRKGQRQTAFPTEQEESAVAFAELSGPKVARSPPVLAATFGGDSAADVMVLREVAQIARQRGVRCGLLYRGAAEGLPPLEDSFDYVLMDCDGENLLRAALEQEGWLEGEGQEAKEQIAGPSWVHVGTSFLLDMVRGKDLQVRTVWWQQQADDISAEEEERIFDDINREMQDLWKESGALSEESEIPIGRVMQIPMMSETFLRDMLVEDFVDVRVETADGLRDVFQELVEAPIALDASDGDGDVDVNLDLNGFGLGIEPADMTFADEQIGLPERRSTPSSAPATAAEAIEVTAAESSEGPGTTSSGTKFCIECGAKLPRRAKFCSECGASQQ
eukprot:scaffold2739_cov257-Pinguiococcus_pyrenoidosus.AAC.29